MALMITLAQDRRSRIRDRARIAIFSVMLVVAVAAAVRGQSSTVDSDTSRRLTEYLKRNRLPLVGAQVSHTDAGDHQVMLYGFVATQFGKTDAEKKARRFLKDPDVEIVNRIAVRPEIGNLKPKTAGEAPNPEPTEDPWAQIMREMREENPP